MRKNDIISVMVNFSKSDIDHLANLSGLSLSDEESEELGQDLQNIIERVRQLDNLDTSDVEPTYQTTGLSNVWREDVIKQDIDKSALLELSPEARDDQIKVPKVL